MCPVGVLADDRDQVAVHETGIDDDAVADREAVDARLQAPRRCRRRRRRGSAASGPTGDPRLHPDIEPVERRGSKPDEHLARRRRRVGDILVEENLGPAVLVDPDRFHRTILSHDGRGASANRTLARHRRGRRDAGGGLRVDRASHPRAPRSRAVRPDALHDGAARGVVPPGAIAPECPHRGGCGALLLVAGAGAGAERRHPAPLRVARSLRRCSASAWMRSAGASGATTAFSSTRTTMSIARRRFEPASGSTGRTRW